MQFHLKGTSDLKLVKEKKKLMTVGVDVPILQIELENGITYPK